MMKTTLVKPKHGAFAIALPQTACHGVALQTAHDSDSDGDCFPTRRRDRVAVRRFVLPLLGCWVMGATLGNALAAGIKFENRSNAAGLSWYSGESYGASWGDVDSDGLPDIYISHHREMPSLYVNQGDGTFVDLGDQIDSWMEMPEADTHGGSWVDFDNDGDQDLFATVELSSKNNFLVNMGGRLVDQADIYDPALDQWLPRLPVWFDYSGDGLLDFIMGSGPRAGVSAPSPTALFRQTTDGFLNQTEAMGVDCTGSQALYLADVTGDRRTEIICSKAQFPRKIYDYSTTPFKDLKGILPISNPALDVAIGDFNGDLVSDFFVVKGDLRLSDAQVFASKRIDSTLITLSKQEKGFSFAASGTLTIDVNWNNFAADRVMLGASGAHPAGTSFRLSAADPDHWGMVPHDSATDEGLYIGYDKPSDRWTVSLSSGKRWQNAVLKVSAESIARLTSHGFGKMEKPVAPDLILSREGGFVMAAGSTGLGAPVSCVSAAAADFDNDMDLDLYLVCRGGVRNLPNRLYENLGKGIFAEVSGAGGAAGIVGPTSDGAGTGDSVSIADFDADGFMDLLVTNGLNMMPRRTGGPDQLFRNQGNGNRWMELDLVGTESNRDAIGARVVLTAGGVKQLREQNGGFHRWSQHHQRIHFGLGENSVASIRVYWPSGLVEDHGTLNANRLYRIEEGKGLKVAAESE